MYINYLPSAVNCNCDLFADNSVLYHKIITLLDSDQLQSGLSSVHDRCQKWLVTLKKEKCKVLHISKKKEPFTQQYELDKLALSTVEQHKHLGIWLQSTLSWDCHMKTMCAKANRVLGLVRRTFGYKNPSGVKIAFNALVRPILEYACQVWNPSTSMQSNPYSGMPQDQFAVSRKHTWKGLPS